MKFKNITTGTILEPNSKEVIEQLKVNPDYIVVNDKKEEPKKVETKIFDKKTKE